MEISTTTWIILAGGLATYLTRIGGHLVLSRFSSIHPRVEAALNAVPAAVLTTLVAPAAVFSGPARGRTHTPASAVLRQWLRHMVRHQLVLQPLRQRVWHQLVLLLLLLAWSLQEV